MKDICYFAQICNIMVTVRKKIIENMTQEDIRKHTLL